MFGLVGLLVVIAIVASLGRTQLKAVQGSAESASRATGTAVPPPAETIPQQSTNLQNQVRDRVTKTLQQGADRAASQP